ncbi:hypothetical protein [Terriglobus sp.]|uniref:hypothetical protein n=1 Tax=Terriglobus sp. TaxID=1889013 RepID=UPI003AFF9294
MTLNEVASSSAKLLLKSEYGPISSYWPVVAFSQASFETQIRRNYQTGRDFVVYLGTKDEKTIKREDRGALLSVVEIDTTRTYDTYNHISPDAKAWASKDYPGQWLRCFRALRAFDLPSRPIADQLLPNTNRNMWHVPFREVIDQDRMALLALPVLPVPNIDVFARSHKPIDVTDLLRSENKLASQEAVRLADLVMNRVMTSGELVQHRAPLRTAPTDLQIQILSLLLRKPLLCSLCNGEMPLSTENKLLRISGDRKDSSLGDYGPDNYQLVHLGCNFAKNNATEEQFRNWLEIASIHLQRTVVAVTS